MTGNGTMEIVFRIALRKYKVVKAPTYGCIVGRDNMGGGISGKLETKCNNTYNK